MTTRTDIMNRAYPLLDQILAYRPADATADDVVEVLRDTLAEEVGDLTDAEAALVRRIAYQRMRGER